MTTSSESGVAAPLQDGASAKLVDNPRAGRMPADPGVTTRTPAGGPTMPASPKPHGTSDSAVSRMERFDGPEPRPDRGGKGDMRPRPGDGQDHFASGYIRLRIRIAGERMQIVGARAVDGPLAAPASFVGEFACEIMLDATPLAVEGLPDVGVSRSYPRPGQHEHNFETRNVFEFNVRIPKAALSEDALQRLRITLYRFPDASVKHVVGSLSLAYEQQARVVARIEGVRAQDVEGRALEDLKRLFPASLT